MSESKTVTMRFDSKATSAAASFEDNSIVIFDTVEDKAEKHYFIPGDQLEYPVTCFAWKPGKQYLLGACVNGSVIKWTPKHLNTVEQIELNSDDLYHTIDYGIYSHNFCIAGEYHSIEIYDEESMLMLQNMGSDEDPAHSEKIVVCRYFKDGSDMLYSGGMDGKVKFWDLRTG